MTLGEQRVRTKFNPSAQSIVDLLKEDHAQLINKINGLQLKPVDGDSIPDAFRLREFERMKALAITRVEEAAMWAVKAATY